MSNYNFRILLYSNDLYGLFLQKSSINSVEYNFLIHFCHADFSSYSQRRNKVIATFL